ncbi:hypothetical protein HDU98_002847 [Podochytrium sp. JEL0797]|nr:hypothetical protein HDU98_002847 [Podochytrium sp. JEL0797]
MSDMNSTASPTVTTTAAVPTPYGWAPGIPYPLRNVHDFNGPPVYSFPASAPPPPNWPANFPWPPAAVLIPATTAPVATDMSNWQQPTVTSASNNAILIIVILLVVLLALLAGLAFFFSMQKKKRQGTGAGNIVFGKLESENSLFYGSSTNSSVFGVALEEPSTEFLVAAVLAAQAKAGSETPVGGSSRSIEIV